MGDFRLPFYRDSRSTIRSEPYVAPIHGNGSGGAGGYRQPGVARLHVLGGVNYGLPDQVRAATGVIRRADAAAVSHVPVGVTRPVWARFSLTGIQADYGYGQPGAPGVPAGQPGPGSGCGDCG